jgi:transcriptional regulator with GAF, ATPase, and Fis domain
MPRCVDALTKISTAIQSTRELAMIEEQLLGIIAEEVPADRGALLLLDENNQQFASLCGWDSRADVSRPVDFSRNIIDQVLQKKTPAVFNDLAAGTTEGGQITAALAVPLVVFQQIRGVIYLDSTESGVRFSPDDLEWVKAVGGIAAVVLEGARRIEWLEGENRRLLTEIHLGHEMVGSSAALDHVQRFIARVASSEATVLICGESGTGKELVARSIHRHSSRADMPFVAVNCAAIVETLLESELFGHEKGAFTGAVAQQKGKLEVANGGTVFLDEIGELAPGMQAKLLRVLQEREFERVGGRQPVRVDIRIIAATNRDLKNAIREKSFRQDLYYRLNVVSVTVPPLRSRREDIPLLAMHFVTSHEKKARRKVKGITEPALEYLTRYDWPGNVRELENAIERAMVLGTADMLLPEDLPEEILETEPGVTAAAARYHAGVRESKKRLIVTAVAQANGNFTEAARLLGVHPNYLHRLVRNLNLREILAKAV